MTDRFHAGVVSGPTPEDHAITGVRRAAHAPDDSPTEEIDLDPEVFSDVAPAPAVRPRTSMPPPPPREALRVRSLTPTPSANGDTLSMPKSVRELRDVLHGGDRPTPRTPTPVPGSLEAEIERVKKQMRERDAYLTELEAVFAQRSEALIAAEVRERALLTRIEELEESVRSLEEQAAVVPIAMSMPGDDLRRIRGIGPGYERALRAMGVDSFAVIAAWSPEQAASVGERLNMSAGRILRERWIEQAAELLGPAVSP